MVLNFEVNYIAVVVAAIASFVIGFLWYGPIFGKVWMKLNSMGKADVEKAKKKGMAFPMPLNLVGTLVTAFVVAVLILSLDFAGYVGGAVGLAFWVWLGFFATTTLLGAVLWDNKPWGLFVLNGTYWLVTLEIISVILSLWS